MKEILGPEGLDLVVTEDPVQDKNQSAAFAAEARQQHRVSRDPKDSKRALLLVGAEEWPLPIPVVQQSGKWRFDSKAGRQEILYRRIGRNELDAIEVCHGFVEAQMEYAAEKRGGSTVNQYAQRIISTPGKQDGLAWQAADGTWQGPVGEAVFGWMGMDGRLTCVDIQSSTAGLDELHRVGNFEVDALDLPAPDRPFGPYAKPQPDFAEGE